MVVPVSAPLFLVVRRRYACLLSSCCVCQAALKGASPLKPPRQSSDGPNDNGGRRAKSLKDQFGEASSYTNDDPSDAAAVGGPPPRHHTHDDVGGGRRSRSGSGAKTDSLAVLTMAMGKQADASAVTAAAASGFRVGLGDARGEASELPEDDDGDDDDDDDDSSDGETSPQGTVMMGVAPDAWGAAAKGRRAAVDIVGEVRHTRIHFLRVVLDG